jgi:hypothetical protein
MEIRNAYKISVGKHQENRPCGKLRHRSEDTEMELRGV